MMSASERDSLPVPYCGEVVKKQIPSDQAIRFRGRMVVRKGQLMSRYETADGKCLTRIAGEYYVLPLDSKVVKRIEDSHTGRAAK